MRVRPFYMAILIALLFVSSCVAYRVPYLTLDIKSSPYTDSDIKFNYTYVCEDRDQRCVYSLYETSNPSVILDSRDEVMPSTGLLDFSGLGLGEGDYRLDFLVYTERDGIYSLLNYLDESFDFTIDFP